MVLQDLLLWEHFLVENISIPPTGAGDFERGLCAHTLTIRRGLSTQTLSLRTVWDGEKQWSILTFGYTAPRWLRCISKEKFQWPKILAHVHTQQYTVNKIVNLRSLFFVINSNLLPRFMLFFKKCGPFFKDFIVFVTILLLFLFYVLVFWPQGMWDPSSSTRD